MPEFSVRIEYERDVEADPVAMCNLVGFCIRRVVNECEALDLFPRGTLRVVPKPRNPEIEATGMRVQSVDLVLEYDQALADYSRELARLRREAA